MSTVIDTITADTVEEGDVIEYVGKKGQSHTVQVKTVEDKGNHILVTGLPDDLPGGEKVTIRFQPDDYVDLLGA